MRMFSEQSTKSIQAAQQLIFHRKPNKFYPILVAEGPLPGSRLPALVSHLSHKNPVLTLALYPYPVLTFTLRPYANATS
jgi:hypothetical protein